MTNTVYVQGVDQPVIPLQKLAKGLHGYLRSHGPLGTVIKRKKGLSSKLVLNIHIGIMPLIYSHWVSLLGRTVVCTF
jgi:hypothetical protein